MQIFVAASILGLASIVGKGTFVFYAQWASLHNV